ncbi:MAG TPA: hypothetical protein VL383_02050 [Gemmatimonadaceae bacterium]|jgi:hypothetical protein|nr:hypothetical protein [Gemmatimonadaceae bacterium]
MNASIDRGSLRRIASTGAVSAPWSNTAHVITRFVVAPRRLPTFFGTPMVAHALSSRLPAPAQLHALVSALRGRLAVANHQRAVRLPNGLATAVNALVRAGLDESVFTDTAAAAPGGHSPAHARALLEAERDPRAVFARRMVQGLLTTFPSAVRDQLSRGVTWAALALYESATPTVRLDPSAAIETGSRSVLAAIDVDYHVVIAAGSDIPLDWQALDATAVAASATAWPPHRRRPRHVGKASEREEYRAWFVVPLLVPDAWLAEHADATTLAHWARLTGRSGAPDRYWFPESWDRFLEPGRRIGWLTASDVWRPRRGRLASAAGPDAEAESSAGSVSRHPPSTLSPDLERGVGVPPGYALVQCAGHLSVGVVVDRERVA